MSPSAPLPTRIGRFEVLRVLGRGAMATVYEARDPSLDRIVAIKTLAADSEPELAERFLREARAVAKLAHPHVMAIYDIGREAGTAYIVMEIVRGGSLKDRLVWGQPWPVAAVWPVAEQLLDALAFVHSAGIVHRDIKPANVMLDEQGRVKLADFGVARVLSAPDRTQTGSVIGTPRFMAPEQMLGNEVGPRADLFSAGALLYQLFTGREPFAGQSVYEVMHAVMQSQPQLPSKLPGSALPAELDAVLLRAMAREPSARFASAVEMAGALHKAIDPHDELVTAPAPPPAQPAWLPAEPSAGPAGPADAADPFAALALDATMVRAPSAPGLGAAPRALPPDFDLLAPPGPAPAGDGTMFFAPPRPASASAAARLHLVVTASADARDIGRSRMLDGDELQLGREATCHFVLNDSACSRRHTLLRRAGAGFTIEDQGSTNGTWLDARPLPPGKAMPLVPGATIRIGETLLAFNHADDTTLPPDLVGQVLAGRYTLEAVLRASPKATVYAARAGAGPRVALKLLSPALAAYPGYVERLRQAAELASRLQHPHVCPLLDHGEASLSIGGRAVSTPFLCHALLGGGSLAQRMADTRTVATSDIARWLRQIGDALVHAHKRGVVHGDIKPTSIAFDDDGNAYLMDFSVPADAAAGDAPLFGAPAYMAPELWAGEAPSAASDQFALAALAYALLTGARPFSGHEDPKLRERSFRRGAAPAHEEARHAGREDLPRGVSAVLQRALALPAADRYPAMAEFMQALDKAWRGGARAGSGLPSVFVSYRHEPSAGWAVLLARELKDRHKVAAFVDTQRLDAAVQFPDKLARAIERCDVFVCLLAAGTLESRWVLEEIRLAHRHGKPMVPIFQESFGATDLAEQEDAVRALLQFDGVHLLDRRNIHIDHTIDDLARLVLGTLRTGSG